MKALLKSIYFILSVSAVFLIVSCGGSGESSSDNEDENVAENIEVVLSEKGELLCSVAWKLDPNATLKGTTDVIEDSTSIIANIELKGDVKAFADFVAETVSFAKDQNDPTKLAYSRKIGEGFLSTSVLGYWEFNENETAIIMKEWDSQLGQEKDPVTYNIIELSDEKLVIQKEGDSSPNIYFPK